MQSESWRELRPRLVNPADAMALITEMRDQQIKRLTRLIGDHEQWAAEEAVDLPDRAAFDPSAGFERHRRYRTALGREMLRTMDTLRKLRKDGRDMEDAGCNPGGVTDLKETAKIGILSHTEEETDKIGVLSHVEEETDKTGILSADDEARLEKVQNEAKSALPQANVGKGVASENGSRSDANQSQFPVSAGRDARGHRPPSNRLVGETANSPEPEIGPDGTRETMPRDLHGKGHRSVVNGSTTERIPILGRWI